MELKGLRGILGQLSPFKSCDLILSAVFKAWIPERIDY